MFQGYYINLEHRTERKLNIESIQQKFPQLANIKRFNAIKHQHGGIGCTLSHVNVLSKLDLLDETYFLVLEDDFNIINEEGFRSFLNDFEKIKEDNWDIIVLTPCYSTIFKESANNNFYRIKSTQTTTGYIIKKTFVNILKTNFEKSIQLLENSKDYNKYSCDQYWKKLQNDHIFLCYNRIFANQLPGISDVEHKYVDYTNFLLYTNKLEN